MNFLIDCLKTLNIYISYDESRLLLSYLDYLLNKNKYINLVSRSIISYESNIALHLVDSLSILKWPWSKTLKVIDFGSGGGLPGIPLKLVNENWILNFIESKNKKAQFIIDACSYLNLIDCNIYNFYFSNKLKNNIDLCDLFICRGVADLQILIPIASSLLLDGGYFVAYKGPKGLDELNKSEKILINNKLEFIEDFYFSLPYTDAARHLFLFKKQLD